MSSSLEGGPPPASEPPQDVERLGELRDILLRGDEAYLSETVESVLDGAMSRKIAESKDEMAAVMAPIMGQAIRQQVTEAQDDIIDALYPVIGRTIQRSVSESMRALARRVDQNLRSTLSLGRMLRRLQARIRGVPESELLLRDSLPFGVHEVFLIHRESGLLLEHLSREPGEVDEAGDRDLVSSMLTAIRDFAEDSFGSDRDGELDEIQYGDVAILLEPGRWAYLAAVIEGYEPEGFRHEMRSVLSDVNREYGSALQEYDGDPSVLADVDEILRPLLSAGVAEVEEDVLPSGPPWLAIAGASAILVLCLSAACFVSWRLTLGRPDPTPTATETARATFTATWTATPTATATATATPTSTRTPSPTSTATATVTLAPSSTLTPTPTARPIPSFTPTPEPTYTPEPYLGIMLGKVWLREEPRNGSPTTGDTVLRGRPVEILAVFDEWVLVHWPPGDAGGTSGWVPERWVGLLAPAPEAIVTPGP